MKSSSPTFRLVLRDVAIDAYARDEAFELEGISCLRHLPGRRSVWTARHRGRDMVLKVFAPHPKQSRDVRREWENTSRMHAAGLAIAAPLFTAVTDEGEHVVAYEFIPEGETLDTVLSGAGEELRRRALRALLALHAAQHAIGCYQSDDHLGNYLWAGDELFILDAGSCVMVDSSLGMSERVKNLAMLTANIPLPMRALYDAEFSAYLDLCPEEINHEVLRESLEKSVPDAVVTRLNRYLRKTRRSSSKLEQVSLPGKSWHACRDMPQGLKDALLENPQAFFNHGERQGCRMEAGEAYTEVDVTWEEEKYVLRRYSRPPIFQRLFSRPCALENWSKGHALRMVGLSSPRPIACLWHRGPGHSEGDYLLLEKCEGAPLERVTKHGMPEKLNEFWMYLNLLRATCRTIRKSDFRIDESGGLILTDVTSIRFHATQSAYERHSVGHPAWLTGKKEP